MAKSKIQKTNKLSVEGTLSLDDMQIEVEEIGEKDLKELLKEYDGKYVKIIVTLGDEITE